MEFEQACCEMDYILEHLNPIDKKKIPQSVIKFFKDNKSVFYKTNLDFSKNLKEQELKDETRAFIEIINTKYFGQEYMQDKKVNESITKEDLDTVIKPQDNQSKELIIWNKDNKILRWLKKIFRIKDGF